VSYNCKLPVNTEVYFEKTLKKGEKPDGKPKAAGTQFGILTSYGGKTPNVMK